MKKILDKIINSEVLTPVRDFEDIESEKERKIKLIFSICFIVVNSFFIVAFLGKDSAIDFFSSFIDAELNITSLLLSFSIAYLTMLITASGENIDILKKTKSKNIRINKNETFLFQILLTELTFSIYLEIILLLILIINKYLVFEEFIGVCISLFLLEALILLDILFLLLKLIKNIYFSFWKV